MTTSKKNGNGKKGDVGVDDVVKVAGALSNLVVVIGSVFGRRRRGGIDVPVRNRNKRAKE